MDSQYEHYLQSVSRYNQQLQDSNVLENKHLEKLAQVSELLTTGAISAKVASSAIHGGIKLGKSYIKKKAQNLRRRIGIEDEEEPEAPTAEPQGPAPSPPEPVELQNAADFQGEQARPTALTEDADDTDPFGTSQAGRAIRPGEEDEEFGDVQPASAPSAPEVPTEVSSELPELGELGDVAESTSLLDAVPVVGEALEVGLGLAAVGLAIKGLFDHAHHHAPAPSDITLPSFQPGV